MTLLGASSASMGSASPHGALPLVDLPRDCGEFLAFVVVDFSKHVLYKVVCDQNIIRRDVRSRMTARVSKPFYRGEHLGKMLVFSGKLADTLMQADGTARTLHKNEALYAELCKNHFNSRPHAVQRRA